MNVKKITYAESVYMCMVISIFCNKKIRVVSENIQFCEHYALVYYRCI